MELADSSNHLLDSLKDDEIPARDLGWARFVEHAPPKGAQGTVRIAALLRIVAAHNASGMKLNEIAKLAGLEQSSAHRIVLALHSVGFLYRDARSRKFFLGPLLFELFTTAFPYFDIGEICLPSLTRLAEKSGDTVYVTIRSGLDGVCIERREGSYPIRTCTVDVGLRRPLGIGTGSLAMLSAFKDAESNAIIDHNAEQYLKFGVTADAVRQSVAQAREQGYVYQEVWSAPGVNAIAVPIKGRTGRPFGSLSMTAIASRLTANRAQDLVASMRIELEEIEKHVSEQNYF